MRHVVCEGTMGAREGSGDLLQDALWVGKGVVCGEMEDVYGGMEEGACGGTEGADEEMEGAFGGTGGVGVGMGDVYEGTWGVTDVVGEEGVEEVERSAEEKLCGAWIASMLLHSDRGIPLAAPFCARREEEREGTCGDEAQDPDGRLQRGEEKMLGALCGCAYHRGIWQVFSHTAPHAGQTSQTGGSLVAPHHGMGRRVSVSASQCHWCEKAGQAYPESLKREPFWAASA